MRRGRHEQLGVEEDPPEGLIFHAAGPIEGGWGIIDFWESREALRPLSREPARAGDRERSATRGRRGRPDIKEFPVHKIIKP